MNDHVDEALRGPLNMILGTRIKPNASDHERLVELAEAHHAVFDEWDSAMLHDLLGSDLLAKPVQDLLIALSQIDITKDSFGLDAERTVQFLIPKLKALRAACVEKLGES